VPPQRRVFAEFDCSHLLARTRHYISNTTLLPATAEYIYGKSPLNIFWGKLGINKIRNLKMDRVVGDDEYVYGSRLALLGKFGEFAPWQKYVSLRTGT